MSWKNTRRKWGTCCLRASETQIMSISMLSPIPCSSGSRSSSSCKTCSRTTVTGPSSLQRPMQDKQIQDTVTPNTRATTASAALPLWCLLITKWSRTAPSGTSEMISRDCCLTMKHMLQSSSSGMMGLGILFGLQSAAAKICCPTLKTTWHTDSLANRLPDVGFLVLGCKVFGCTVFGSLWSWNQDQKLPQPLRKNGCSGLWSCAVLGQFVCAWS